MINYVEVHLSLKPELLLPNGNYLMTYNGNKKEVPNPRVTFLATDVYVAVTAFSQNEVIEYSIKWKKND